MEWMYFITLRLGPSKNYKMEEDYVPMGFHSCDVGSAVFVPVFTCSNLTDNLLIRLNTERRPFRNKYLHTPSYNMYLLFNRFFEEVKENDLIHTTN